LTDYSGTPLAHSMYQVEYLQQELLDHMELMESMEGSYSSPSGQYDPVEYYHIFYALLSKQHNLYTRIKLINSPQLEGLRVGIESFCAHIGMSPMDDIDRFHIVGMQRIINILSQLTGEDMDNYDGIDIQFNW